MVDKETKELRKVLLAAENLVRKLDDMTFYFADVTLLAKVHGYPINDFYDEKKALSKAIKSYYEKI